MSVKDEYLTFRNGHGLKTSRFKDRVELQRFIKGKLGDIWREKPKFMNGGLLSNYMTKYAIGFAYYDCRPTRFCLERCYGLPISGMHDYFMLRLGVITSEAFRNGDSHFISIMEEKIRKLKLECLKIGHWGDAVPEQIPHIVAMVKRLPETVFWWYTRKQEIAMAVNGYELPNLRAYLSLDPAIVNYPDKNEYPFGITYLFGDGEYHRRHDDLLKDPRLVAVFPLKRGRFIENPEEYGVASHPKICIEKYMQAHSDKKGQAICLSCSGRCNYAREVQ